MKKVVFRFRNGTPGAWRYEEIDSRGFPITTDENGKTIGTLYVRKTQYDEPPDYLTITIEEGVQVKDQQAA